MPVPRPLSIASALVGLTLVVAACNGAGGASAAAPTSASAPAATGPSAQAPAASANASTAAGAPLPTLTPVATIGPIHFPAGLVATSDAVWTVSHADGTVLRIDPATNAITDTIPVGKGSANALMLIDGKLWANDQEGGRLVEIDPVTRKVVGEVKAGGDGAWVVAGDGAIWTLGPDPTLVRVDPATRKVVATHVADPGCTDSLAAGGGWVWTGGPDGTICRIDPKTGKVVARGPGLVSPGAGIAWAGDHLLVPGADGGVVVVDPQVVSAAAVFPPPDAGMFDGGKLALGSPGENVQMVATTDGYWIQYSGATIARLAPGDAAHPWTLYAGLPASAYGGVGVLEAFGSLWVAAPNDAPGAAGGGRVIRLTLPQG
jgi:hypothetical protein